MKKVWLFFYLLSLPLFSNEVESLEILIDTTKLQLTYQEEVLVILKEFQQTRASFLASNDDPHLGTEMVRLAMRLHTLIEKAHLSHIFTPEMLEEIAFFNDMGHLHRIKR